MVCQWPAPEWLLKMLIPGPNSGKTYWIRGRGLPTRNQYTFISILGDSQHYEIWGRVIDSIKAECFSLHSNFPSHIFKSHPNTLCSRHMAHPLPIKKSFFLCLLGLCPWFCSTCLKCCSLPHAAIKHGFLITFFARGYIFYWTILYSTYLYVSLPMRFWTQKVQS